jgi:hypothetical protein
MKRGSILCSARADSRASVSRFGYMLYTRATEKSPMDGGDGGALAHPPSFYCSLSLLNDVVSSSDSLSSSDRMSN